MNWKPEKILFGNTMIHLRWSWFLGRDIWHIFDVKQVGNRLDGCFYCSLISPCQVGRVTCAPRHPQPRMSTGPIHSFLLSFPLFELNLLGVSFDWLLCNSVFDTSSKFKGWDHNDFIEYHIQLLDKKNLKSNQHTHYRTNYFLDFLEL